MQTTSQSLEVPDTCVLLALLLSLASNLPLAVPKKRETITCILTMVNIRIYLQAFIVSTCILLIALSLEHLQRGTPKEHSVRTLAVADIGILSQALDILTPTITRKTLSVTTTMPMRTSSHHLLIPTTMTSTGSRPHPFRRAFLPVVYLPPSSRRTRHLLYLQATERAPNLLLTISTRLPETIRKDLALAVPMTVRQHLALGHLSVPQTSLVHSRNLSCTAAQTQGQLLRKVVVQLEITHITRLASAVTQNLRTVVLLPDQRNPPSGVLTHLRPQSRISLFGRMPLILSQSLKSWALPVTLPLKAQKTCLVSIISLACIYHLLTHRYPEFNIIINPASPIDAEDEVSSESYSSTPPSSDEN
jgi:hypothetical protein